MKLYKINCYVERLDGAGVVIDSFREWNINPDVFKCYAIDINFGSSREIDTIWTDGHAIISRMFVSFILKDGSNIYIIPYRTIAPTDLKSYIPEKRYEIDAKNIDDYYIKLVEYFCK